MVDAQTVGAMGETIVLYELMFHGWLPANVNTLVRNARNIDVIAIKEHAQVALSIKTSGFKSNSNFQLGGISESKVFNRHSFGAQAQFVCFVILSPKSAHDYCCYVVPVKVAEEAIQNADRHWRSHPKRDGGERKPGIRGIRFTGCDTPGNIGAGFENKWSVYKDAWYLLDLDHKTL
jgi:hypothetical protein